MLTSVTYYLIFGKPLIMYLGILTLLCFLLVAMIGFLIFKGKLKPPIVTLRNHLLLARIAIALALIHGLLGILAYFK